MKVKAICTSFSVLLFQSVEFSFSGKRKIQMLTTFAGVWHCLSTAFLILWTLNGWAWIMGREDKACQFQCRKTNINGYRWIFNSLHPYANQSGGRFSPSATVCTPNFSDFCGQWYFLFLRQWWDWHCGLNFSNFYPAQLALLCLIKHCSSYLVGCLVLGNKENGSFLSVDFPRRRNII